MRASIIASLFVIALIGLGLRGQLHSGPAPAFAQMPVKTSNRTAVFGPVAAPAPWWKAEIAGEFYSSPAAARQDALRTAARELGVQLEARVPGFRYAPTPRFLVEHRLVNEGIEDKQMLNDPAAPVMVRNKLTIEVSDSQMARLLDEDRRERSVERLWQAGRGLAGILVALVALVGYVRLDDWTKGYFSTFLKFTALALAAAGAVVLWYLV